MPGLLLEMDAQGLPVIKAPEYGFVVSHQKLELEVDFTTQSLKGRTELTILPQTRDLKKIRIDARQCVIPHDGVLVNSAHAEFEYEDPMKAMDIPSYFSWGAEQFEMQRDRIKPMTDNLSASGALEITFPKSVRPEEVDRFSDAAVAQRAIGASLVRTPSIALEGSNNFQPPTPISTPKTAVEQPTSFQPITISIQFSTENFRDGIHFVGLGDADARYPHAYTRHSMDPGTASCIFPCVDDPAMRCTWDISIKCSRTLGDALKKRPEAHKPKTLQQLLVKKGLLTAPVDSVVDEYEVPLSTEEKLLDMLIICSGEVMNDVTDLDDSSKKTVSFLISNVVAPQHIGFAIGPFEQVDLSEFREAEDDEKLGQGQSVPVLGYCLPGRADEVRHTCTPMAHALDFFLLSNGTFPFPECRFVFVDDQIRDVEHTASLSICSTRLLFPEDIIEPEVEVVRKLVHAIASQWIGVSIVPHQRCDRWVTVGLSHFLTGTFMKSLCGHNEYAFRQKMLADQLVEQDITRPSLHALGETLHLGDFELDFMALKAPLVLFILDKRIIKASGSTGLMRVITKIIMTANTGTSADSILTTESFRKLCEKITKYRQTETFWNQWVLGAGCPRFSISQKFNKKRLCVEMTISQKQDTMPTQRKLEKSSFMREFKEDIHGIYAGDMQSVFTGPLTIRIHEADGTPYEHIVEIREGVAKIEIPYNTKYKRLKRSRRQKERQNAGAVDLSGEGGEDALYYCLGDVLSTPAEMKEWGLTEWDADSEARMDQESYEWIRIDADFEWLCEKTFASMPAYMYISQLQQDRDVVAQQESMLYLKNMGPHPLAATFLIRTLMDSRYFHGIRTMAAEYLKTHATAGCSWVGLRHLEKAFQEYFCYPGTKMPRSNDFSEKRAYKVEKAIARSLAMIREEEGYCPKDARQFLLDMLRFNDNTNNEYSDNFKIANLLSALTDSLIPGPKQPKPANVIEHDKTDEEMSEEVARQEVERHERQEFQNIVIEELDRYRRMDEWINSYQNIFTVTVLDCKQRLMKAKVIPLDALEFAQYLHDATAENIRLKAFQALVDLGLMMNNTAIALLLNVLGSDPSPYTRSHIFELFCIGLATVGFGEDKSIEAAPRPGKTSGADSGGDVEMVNGDGVHLDEPEAEGGLIVDQEASTDARKAHIARTTSIEGALAALKIELTSNRILKDALWKAIRSSVIGVREQYDLLDICSVLYDQADSMIIKLRLPRVWKAKNFGKVCLISFLAVSKIPTNPLRVSFCSRKASGYDRRSQTQRNTRSLHLLLHLLHPQSEWSQKRSSYRHHHLHL